MNGSELGPRLLFKGFKCSPSAAFTLIAITLTTHSYSYSYLGATLCRFPTTGLQRVERERERESRRLGFEVMLVISEAEEAAHATH